MIQERLHNPGIANLGKETVSGGRGQGEKRHTACERSVRLWGIECKLEIAVRSKETRRWNCAGPALAEHEQGIACLCKRQARVGGLVTIGIPYDTLGVSCYNSVCRTYRVCVAVFAGGRHGDGGGGVCEVAKVPAKGNIFTRSDLVVGRGLGWGLGKDDFSRVSIGTDGGDDCCACVVAGAACYTEFCGGSGV